MLPLLVLCQLCVNFVKNHVHLHIAWHLHGSFIAQRVNSERKRARR